MCAWHLHVHTCVCHVKYEEIGFLFLSCNGSSFPPPLSLQSSLQPRPSLSLTVAQMESILSEFTDTHPSINKQIYSTYHAHVTNLSRRFFHLLLRYTISITMYCSSSKQYDIDTFVTRTLRAHTPRAFRALHLHYHATWTYAVDDLYLYVYEGSSAHE